MSSVVKSIIGDDSAKKAAAEQKKLLEEQQAQAVREKERLQKAKTAKIRTVTGVGYGQRSLLSTQRNTLG